MIPPPSGGRRLLAAASAGGHFKQLVRLVPRIPDVGSVTWVTYDTGLARDLLSSADRGHENLVYVPYAAPRDAVNLARDAMQIRRLMHQERFDLAISTGAGIAVATLPIARRIGTRAVFIESATRVSEPSLSGRILQRVPGVELCSQLPTGVSFGPGWRALGSVHDEFMPGARRQVSELRRVVVTLGTIRPYGFRRLVARLVEVLPRSADVLWQTGATDTAGLPIEARARVPGPELEAAMDAADVVIAHAGTGTAVTAFERGHCPVLIPRRAAHGEHVDDHQVGTARALSERGLAMYAEVEEVTTGLLFEASSRQVVRHETVPDLDL